MLSKSLTVLELLDLDLTEHDALHLHCVCGQKGLTRSITVADLNRPGLALLHTSVFSCSAGENALIYNPLSQAIPSKT